MKHLLFLSFLISLPATTFAQCNNVTFWYSTNAIERTGGNDVYVVTAAWIEGPDQYSWTGKVTSTIKLNGTPLSGYTNLVGQGTQSGDVVQTLHPQTTGTGTYSVTSTFEWHSSCATDPSPVQNYTQPTLSVVRPGFDTSVTGTGIWWLGGSPDPNASTTGLYTQGYLKAQNNCGSGSCPETPQWVVTQPSPNKIYLSSNSGTQVVATSLGPSGSLGDIKIKYSIGGFESDEWDYTVNEPSEFIGEGTTHYAASTLGYNHGYDSHVKYHLDDLYGNTFASFTGSEQFSTYASDYSGENWPPHAQYPFYATILYGSWFDSISVLCGSATPCLSPVVQNPMGGSTMIDHATQTWRVGGTSAGVGVEVQQNTFQRLQDHGEHKF